MVDIHSHILWGIDDGSKSKEMTINMLKKAEIGGTSKIVATPHFLPGRYSKTFNEIKQSVQNVKTLAKEEGISLEIYLGQEVYFTKNILKDYEEGLIFTINHSRYMLIEFNMQDFDLREVTELLYELQLRGVTPVIAHPERYVKFMENEILINQFIKEGYLFQLNSGSLKGDFGAKVKKLAEKFLKNKIYSFIGSDGHRDEKRDTDMRIVEEVIKEVGYLNYLKKSGEDLLENKDVKFVGSLMKKKTLLSLLTSR